MAVYNPYVYPYQPYAAAPAAVNNSSAGTGGIIWVQGENGAKSYLVAPNTTVQLMDSEATRFYLKSADASGVPMPLRIFEYTEITEKKAEPSVEYATKKDLEALKAEIYAARNAERARDDE